MIEEFVDMELIKALALVRIYRKNMLAEKTKRNMKDALKIHEKSLEETIKESINGKHTTLVKKFDIKPFFFAQTFLYNFLQKELGEELATGERFDLNKEKLFKGDLKCLAFIFIGVFEERIDSYNLFQKNNEDKEELLQDYFNQEDFVSGDKIPVNLAKEIRELGMEKFVLARVCVLSYTKREI